MKTQRIVVIRAKRYPPGPTTDKRNRKTVRRLKLSAAQRNMRAWKGLRFVVEEMETDYELVAYQEV